MENKCRDLGDGGNNNYLLYAYTHGLDSGLDIYGVWVEIIREVWWKLEYTQKKLVKLKSELSLSGQN